MARQPNLSRMVRPHPLRIGLDGDTLGRKRTGDESYLASLMRGLGRTDDANNYVVYVRDPAKVRPSFEELTRFAFRKVLPQSIWVRFPIGLPLALRRDPVDLLHVQYFVPPASPCPVVVTVHDISFAVRPEFFTRKDRFLLKTLVPWSLRRAAGCWRAVPRRLARPPIEVIFFAPVAAVFALVAQTGNPLVARAVVAIAIAGIVVAWVSGVILDGTRDLRARLLVVHVVLAVVAVLAAVYLVIDRDRMIDLLVETWRGGPALR